MDNSSQKLPSDESQTNESQASSPDSPVYISHQAQMMVGQALVTLAHLKQLKLLRQRWEHYLEQAVNYVETLSFDQLNDLQKQHVCYILDLARKQVFSLRKEIQWTDRFLRGYGGVFEGLESQDGLDEIWMQFRYLNATYRSLLCDQLDTLGPVSKVMESFDERRSAELSEEQHIERTRLELEIQSLEGQIKTVWLTLQPLESVQASETGDPNLKEAPKSPFKQWLMGWLSWF